MWQLIWSLKLICYRKMMLLFWHSLYCMLGVSVSGCFSKDQVYLDGILRILRHRRNIDFKMLTSLGKVSVDTFPTHWFSNYGMCTTRATQTFFKPPAGVLWRRGEAAAAGGVPTDQNPTLHARPGAVPATSGSHRRCQRAGRFSPGTSVTLTALTPTPPRHHLNPRRRRRRRSGDAGTQTVSCGALNITYHSVLSMLYLGDFCKTWTIKGT